MSPGSMQGNDLHNQYSFIMGFSSIAVYTNNIICIVYTCSEGGMASIASGSAAELEILANAFK
jgi:hypothetical protein